jgi:hypothetical protein
LTLEEAIEIAQNQDATAHQVGYMRPEFKGNPLQIEVHKLQGTRQSGAKRNRQQPQRPGPNDQPHRTGPVIRNKGSQREKLVSTVERNRHNPKVSVKGNVLQVWEGRALWFHVQIKEQRCMYQRVSSPVWFNS